MERRRWLTVEAREEALAKLRGRMPKGNRNAKEEVADSSLFEAMGWTDEKAQWASLERKLKRAGPIDEHGEPKKREDPDDTVLLAMKLLHREALVITTDDVPVQPSLPPVSSGRGLRINCPSTLDDHRVVILGELQRPGLFPAVFIYAPDLERWFPQYDVLRIKDGVAFCCYARFGNPLGAGQDLPRKWVLRIYALLNEPVKPDELEERPTALTDDDLEALVTACGTEGAPHKQEVRRDTPPLKTITVKAGGKTWTVDPLKRISSRLPVELSWNGGGDLNVEVRKTPYDAFVGRTLDVPPGSSTLFTHAGARTVKNTAKERVVELPQEKGTYRIRARAMRRSFLDPDHEVWLEVPELRTQGLRRSKKKRK